MSYFGACVRACVSLLVCLCNICVIRFNSCVLFSSKPVCYLVMIAVCKCLHLSPVRKACSLIMLLIELCLVMGWSPCEYGLRADQGRLRPKIKYEVSCACPRASWPSTSSLGPWFNLIWGSAAKWTELGKWHVGFLFPFFLKISAVTYTTACARAYG